MIMSHYFFYQKESLSLTSLHPKQWKAFVTPSVNERFNSGMKGMSC